MERFSYESTEPIAIRGIRTDTNPALNSVSILLTPTSNPDTPVISDPDWVVGSWRTPAVQPDGLWKTDAWFTLARQVRPRDTYDVYLWIDGTTYDPVRKVGSVIIY